MNKCSHCGLNPNVLPSVYRHCGINEHSSHRELPSYSSVGGYTIIYYTRSEEPVCGKCATVWDDDTDVVTHVGSYDEGPTVQCCECGTDIASSYGDPDADGDEYGSETEPSGD